MPAVAIDNSEEEEEDEDDADDDDDVVGGEMSQETNLQRYIRV